MIDTIKLKIITNNETETLFIDSNNENDKIMKLIFDIPFIKFNPFKFRYKCLAMYNGKCIRNNTPKEIFGEVVSIINTFLLGTLISKEGKCIGSKQLCKLNGHGNFYKKNIIKFLGFPFNNIILEDSFCARCENSYYPFIDNKQCAYLNFPYNFLHISDDDSDYEDDNKEESVELKESEDSEEDEQRLPWLFSPLLLSDSRAEEAESAKVAAAELAKATKEAEQITNKKITDIIDDNLDSSVNILVCYCENADCNGSGMSNCPVRSGGQHLKKVCKDCAPFYLANQKRPTYWTPFIKIMDENLPYKEKIHDLLHDTLFHLEI
jgi:hypothetical protein